MVHSLIFSCIFLIGAVFELKEIITFERKGKQSKDEEFIYLFRKCHYTYLIIFVALVIDEIISVIGNIS